MKLDPSIDNVDVGDLEDHGVRSAFYAGGPGEPYFQPNIECLCGWESGRCHTWSFAGECFDDHLAEVEKRAASGRG